MTGRPPGPRQERPGQPRLSFTRRDLPRNPRNVRRKRRTIRVRRSDRTGHPRQNPASAPSKPARFIESMVRTTALNSPEVRKSDSRDRSRRSNCPAPKSSRSVGAPNSRLWDRHRTKASFRPSRRPIRVAIGVEIEAVRFADHDAVVQWQNQARKIEIVRKDTVAIEAPISICILMHGYTGHRIEFTTPIHVQHAGPHLRRLHAAVSVKDRYRRLDNLRLRQDHLEMVALRELHAFDGALRRLSNDPRRFGDGGNRGLGLDCRG